MVTLKKRLIASLLVVVCSGGAILLFSSRSDADIPTAIKLGKSDSLFTNDPNFSARSDSNFSTREIFYKMMFSVLLVVVLGAAALYISKKFLPKITNLSGKKIQVTETVHLGAGRSIHLIKTGNYTFLVGSTKDSITKLADLTYPEDDENLLFKEDIK